MLPAMMEHCLRIEAASSLHVASILSRSSPCSSLFKNCVALSTPCTFLLDRISWHVASKLISGEIPTISCRSRPPSPSSLPLTRRSSLSIVAYLQTSRIVAIKCVWCGVQKSIIGPCGMCKIMLRPSSSKRMPRLRAYLTNPCAGPLMNLSGLTSCRSS